MSQAIVNQSCFGSRKPQEQMSAESARDRILSSSRINIQRASNNNTNTDTDLNATNADDDSFTDSVSQSPGTNTTFSRWRTEGILLPEGFGYASEDEEERDDIEEEDSIRNNSAASYYIDEDDSVNVGRRKESLYYTSDVGELLEFARAKNMDHRLDSGIRSAPERNADTYKEISSALAAAESTGVWTERKHASYVDEQDESEDSCEPVYGVFNKDRCFSQLQTFASSISSGDPENERGRGELRPLAFSIAVTANSKKKGGEQRPERISTIALDDLLSGREAMLRSVGEQVSSDSDEDHVSRSLEKNGYEDQTDAVHLRQPSSSPVQRDATPSYSSELEGYQQPISVVSASTQQKTPQTFPRLASTDLGDSPILGAYEDSDSDSLFNLAELRTERTMILGTSHQPRPLHAETGDSFATSSSLGSSSAGNPASKLGNSTQSQAADRIFTGDGRAVGSSQSVTVGETDWNAEFQQILELPESTEGERLEKYTCLSSLSKDFVHIAKTFGKIIISEQVLPPHMRTIKPIAVGGQAGGEKYIYRGILYKFAVDWLDIYGSDEYAMKAAALELKAVTRFYGVHPKLHIPLVALIDYRGWRLVAMSVLPLRENTLIYGSNDGGKTIHADLPAFNKAMRKVAEKICLKGHWCGLGYRVAQQAALLDHQSAPAPPLPDSAASYLQYGMQFLHGPCDIEGHLGYDGRFYCIDFARVFPPTAPDNLLDSTSINEEVPPKARRTSFLYRQFRPEFLQRWGTALSADAFSPFGGPDNAREHNAEVVVATEGLHVHIKLFAESLLTICGGASVEAPSIEFENGFTELIHREGINCRYLGRVRAAIPDAGNTSLYLRAVLLTEMIARVAKNCLRHRLRGLSKQMTTVAEDPYRKETLRFLNIVLGWPEQRSNARIVDEDGADNLFWSQEIRRLLARSFPGSLGDEDRTSSLLHCILPLDRLMERIQRLTGVRLTRSVRHDLRRACGIRISSFKTDGRTSSRLLSNNRPRAFRLVVPDIAKVSSIVKHLPIVPLAEGNALAIESFRARRGIRASLGIANSKLDSSVRLVTAHTDFGTDRLFRLAMTKFEDAIRSTPDNEIVLNNYADVLLVLLDEISQSTSISDLASFAPEKLFAAFSYARIAAQKYAVARNFFGLLRLAELVQSNKLWVSAPSGAASANHALLPNAFLEVAEDCYRRIEQLLISTGATNELTRATCFDINALVYAKHADAVLAKAHIRCDRKEYLRAGEIYRKALDTRRQAVTAFQALEGSAFALQPAQSSGGLIDVRRFCSLKRSTGFAVGSSLFDLNSSTGTLQSSARSTEVEEAGYALRHVLFENNVCFAVSQLQFSESFDITGLAEVILDSAGAPIGNYNDDDARAQEYGAVDCRRLFQSGKLLSENCLLQSITILSGLSYLNVTGCDLAVTSQFLKTLSRVLHSTLLALNISETGSNWTSVDIAQFSELHTLKDLRLNNLIGDHTFLGDHLSLPNQLKKLSIAGNPDCEARRILIRLARSQCQLHSLDLSDLQVSNDCAEIVSGLLHAPVLRDVQAVHLSSWKVFSKWKVCFDSSTRILASLSMLSLNDCQGLDDAALLAIVEKLGALPTCLRSLSIRNSRLLSAEGLLSVVGGLSGDSCPVLSKLESIDASGSKNVGNTHAPILEILMSRLPLLRNLQLGGCGANFHVSQGAKLMATLHSLGTAGSMINDYDVAVVLGHDNNIATPKAGFGRGQVLKLKMRDVALPLVDVDAKRTIRGAVELDLSGAGRQISDVTLRILAQTPPHKENLQSLNLATCSVSDMWLSQILKNCRSLRTLDMSRCKEITDNAFLLCIPDTDDGAFSKSEKVSPTLRSLRARDCYVTDVSVDAVARLFPMLQEVDFGNCKKITQANAFCDFGLVGQLRKLQVDGCDFLSDAGLARIVCANGANRLEELDVFSCPRVTDLTFSMMSHCTADGDFMVLPSLTKLRIGYNKLSDGGFELLVRSRSSTVQIIDSSKSDRRHSIAASRPSMLQLPRETPAQPSADCLRALRFDLISLARDPLGMAAALPLKDDMLTWHVNIAAEDSPYSGAIWHVELRFPPDYPKSSPAATVLTPLPHPHVIRGRVCLDILSDYQSFFEEAAGTEGGWSSAYGVRTIMLQIQAFLLDLSATAEQDETQSPAGHGDQPWAWYLRRIPESVAAARAFTCVKCSHAPSHPWPPFGQLHEDEVDGVMKTATNCLKGEADTISAASVPLEVCYHSRCSWQEDILGIGLTVAYHGRSRTINLLDSPLELLGYRAFYDEGVRTSVNRLPIQFWLPLVLNSNHGKRALAVLPQSVAALLSFETSSFHPLNALFVIAKLMNTMIVRFMKAEQHASLRSLQGYCWLHRWLLLLCTEYPSVRTHINDKVDRFLSSPSGRSKKAVPALGEFLPYLLISNAKWMDIAIPYLHEHLARNVRWLLKDHLELGTWEADDEIDRTRAAVSFGTGAVGFKLLAFHVLFLNRVGRPPISRNNASPYDRESELEEHLHSLADSYDARMGHALPGLNDELQKSVKAIMQMASFQDLFARIGVQCPPEGELLRWLRASVRTSLDKDYHQDRNRKGALARAEDEAGWQEQGSRTRETKSKREGRGGRGNRSGRS